MPTPPLSIGTYGPTVTQLHELLRQRGFELPESETQRNFFGPATRQALQNLQQQNGFPVTGALDERTAALLHPAAASTPVNAAASEMRMMTLAGNGPTAVARMPITPASPAAPATALSTVEGSVTFDYGLPATGITLRLYQIGFGGQESKLAEITSDAQGNYSFSYRTPERQSANLQVRAVDAQKNEIPISTTKLNAQSREVLNLVVPAKVQPLAAEFERLAADMQKHAGSIAELGKAEENGSRRDLSLLSKSSGWDARLLALAATAAQQASTTGLAQDVLYALYRTGMPTDPQHLAMLSTTTVEKALTKASQAGIVNLNDQQISAATQPFANFAINARLSAIAPGAVSKYGDMLNALPNTRMVSTTTWGEQQKAFANLYFANPKAGEDLWKNAAALNIPSATIDALRLQGKFLYLTFNNAKLAQKLQQDIASPNNLAQLVDKDYYDSAAWKKALADVAGGTDDKALEKVIPTFYRQTKIPDRLEAYAANLARKVRFSFPTHVTARMIEKKELPVDAATAPKVANFLKAGAQSGYELGRTPLNAFLANLPANVPALDAASTKSLKVVHRMYQVTPSPESLQAVLKLGFTSAHEIASYTKDEFMKKFSKEFPSDEEAVLVFSQAKTIDSITFNFFVTTKQLDAPPVFSLSPSDDDRQSAKDSVLKQFPTLTNLFGSLDFCQCQECRSVLSPAAYFVDLLQFLDGAPTPSTPEAPLSYSYNDGSGKSKTKYVTGLDVLIGNKNAHPVTNGQPVNLPGRRPDLGALPLTCENTNTAMPYIDLVNEILEYYIVNNRLDAGAAHDTGNATTDDLVAEPQNIQTTVYNTTLKSSVYPRKLPFDLWIETARALLNYFKVSFASVLDVLRPTKDLELFADANNHPYYRAQIFAECLGFSPAEVAVLSAANPTPANWFALYGKEYVDENTALNGKVDPADPNSYITPPLKSAKNLANRLGVSYQELTDLLNTGFLNPSLAALSLQFKRFGISLDKAFSYAAYAGNAQPGFTALTGTDKDDFEALLEGIKQAYETQNSSFDPKAWLKSVLPPNYSTKLLVLNDPDTSCNFNKTTLQYADGSAAKPLDFVKLNFLVRLWKKLGWTLDETDRALQLFFPSLPAWNSANFASALSAAAKTALVNLAHLQDLILQLKPSLGVRGLLPLWSPLPVQGTNPLYAELFLNASVLTSDLAFDDPAGQFPSSASDPLSRHQVTLQGVLGLTADDLTAVLSDAAAQVTNVTVDVNGQNVQVPGFSLTNISILYRYSLLAKCLQLSVEDLINLKQMSALEPFKPPISGASTQLSDDFVFTQTLAFIKQVGLVKSSGFTVEDLKYLLRHQFDSVGKYAPDPNPLISLAQAVANGLRQIKAQENLPADLRGWPDALRTWPEALVEQKLSTLFPTTIVKTLFALLNGAQTYDASQGGVAPGSQITTTFPQEPQLVLSYDSTTQTQSLSYRGPLLDWKMAQLLQIDNSPLFAGLLNQIQQESQSSLVRTVEDVLGVWASLVEYEAVQTGVPAPINGAPLTRIDPAVKLSYDQADKVQRLAYRGVLTDAKKNALLAINNAGTMVSLIADIQQQCMSDYRALIGTVLAAWTSLQTYQASQGALPANQVDATVFAPYPEVQLSYDSSSQTQTLSYKGALTDSVRSKLAQLVSGSTLLGNLLQTVRNQAVQFFQFQAGNMLSATASEIDAYSQPLLGINDAAKQKELKKALVKVFVPFFTQKLSREFILQTVAGALSADLALTGALLTNAALLSDPNNLGKSLLKSFLAIAEQGVTATFYKADGSVLASGMASSVDTADPVNSGSNQTDSAHFEGYFQVATDGPCRFFAQLGDPNAELTFQLDSPDASTLFADPKFNGQRSSEFVQLKGGVPYRFSADFNKLGSKNASVLVQGENLPKGPFSQLLLYPEQAITDFTRARMLLAKVLQISQGLALDEREISYLIANASQFSNLKLSALPTQASDDSQQTAAQKKAEQEKLESLFSQFLTLADYADLRKTVAGNSNALVDVFGNVGQTFSATDADAPWTLLGNLTRRDPQVVLDVARALGDLIQDQANPAQSKAIGDFANNQGIRRIWEALKMVQLVRIPIASLRDVTMLVGSNPPAGTPTPDVIANGLKNALKARYAPGSWRPIAKSIFDKLRQKKRDALIAYLLDDQTLHVKTPEQLFEYFLVDPQMEPVVQTSRLRLALSSVQTFVQRCLLNLENGNTEHPERNVSPTAIDADWWSWMKRYRVWQANREIFLFPENWMEPELRMDKSDLFQALEGALLQGDVTRDLVEDAFYSYLKGLEVRARLDVVSSYLEQDTTHGLSTVHVLARTYGKPHKHFYRTYSNEAWSAWLSVTPQIDSDHLALVVWRGRLNLFWVTFLQKAQPNSTSPSGTGAISGMDIHALANAISGFEPEIQYQVQLHWSEYFQGKWSDPIVSDIDRYEPLGHTTGAFDPNKDVYIFVSKELDQEGNEGAIKINLERNGVSFSRAFRVTSKNCNSDFADTYYDSNGAPPVPYDNSAPDFPQVDATVYTGAASLQAYFKTEISPTGDGTPAIEPILNKIGTYSLLLPDNRVAPLFIAQSEPLYWQAGSLVSPFFYKDETRHGSGETAATVEELTFFVQPSLKEDTIDKWERWAIPPDSPDKGLVDASVLDGLVLVSQVPHIGPINPGDPENSLYQVKPPIDWVSNPRIAISYGESWIGAGGGITAGQGAGINLGHNASLGRVSLDGSSISAGLGASSRQGFTLVGIRGLGLNQLQNIKASQQPETFGNTASSFFGRGR